MNTCDKYNVLVGCKEDVARQIAEKYNATFISSATSAINAVDQVAKFFLDDGKMHIYHTNNILELRIIELKADSYNKFDHLEVFDLHNTDSFDKAIPVLYSEYGMSELYENWNIVLNDLENALTEKYGEDY